MSEDRDWILAMGHALGLDSGFRIPVQPDVEAFKRLFAEIRAKARGLPTMDLDVPLTVEGDANMEHIMGRARQYQRLRDGADVRSWAADQLHDDVKFLLAHIATHSKG